MVAFDLDVVKGGEDRVQEVSGGVCGSIHGLGETMVFHRWL